ncbi:MAG TPA: hypothetical protein VN903_14280 [Polyangia bacterium]|nr:hypothetical protein [Polyangia bacterium]
MSAEHAQKNGQSGNLRVERGGRDVRGRRRSMMRTSEEIVLMDRVQQRYLTLVSERGTISRAIEQIAAGNQRPTQSIARRILELRAVGIPAAEREEIALGDVIRWNRALDSQHKPAA